MATSGQAATAAAALPNLDPVAAIQSILDAEKAPPETKEQVPAETEAQPVTEEAPPEANTQVEGEDAPPQEDAPAATEISLDQLEAIELEVTVKGEDGKDVAEKTTVKDLRDGYMRLKDYRAKTAEIARHREELGNQTRQAVESERSQYVKILQELQSVILDTVAPELKDVNWNTLSTTDPFEYVRLDNRRKQITDVLTNLQSKQVEASEKQQAERKTETTKIAQKTLETLQTEIPGWSPTLYQALLKSGEDLGYKREEVANWIDARAIKLLHKAYLYDQLKAGKPLPGQKTAIAPKVIKPGASASVSQAQQKHGEAMKRLQDTGRVEDAAAVIRARMG